MQMFLFPTQIIQQFNSPAQIVPAFWHNCNLCELWSLSVKVASDARILTELITKNYRHNYQLFTK